MRRHESDLILIAIGANLTARDGTSPRQSCAAAVAGLRALPGLRLVAVSTWIETAPVPASDQPWFVNGAARLAGAVDPAALLAALHGLEAAAGRVRGLANAARTLDLDLIAVGSVLMGEAPVLPHPRAHERAFVLEPLAEIAAGWVHPLLGLTAAEMLERRVR